MSKLEIIGVPFSNYVRAIRMLCQEKGVAYELIPVRPHTPEVLAISPIGLIPCLRHGDVTLYESKALATYIDKAFPGPKFIPEDALGAAKVEQWVSYGNVKIDRWVMREFVVQIVFADKEKGPNQARIELALPEITKCLDVLEGQLSKTSHLVGNGLTFADMNVLPMLALLPNFPQSKAILAAHPKVEAYIARLSARPSFVDTAPPPRK